MERDLAGPEVRVVGCLMEKQLATPDYYPLTMNALVAACNQSSNRSPVVNYDATTVQEAIDGLRAKGAVRIVHSPSQRAAKYRHVLDEELGLDRPEAAVLCVLLLRGPQTPGELRSRTERMHAFEDNAALDHALDWLAERDLVARLERQPGQKEARWIHLLGEPADTPTTESPIAEPLAGAASGASGDRISRLEAEVAQLREELAELRKLLGE